MRKKIIYWCMVAMYAATTVNCHWQKTEQPKIVIPAILSFSASSSYYWQVGYSADTVLSLSQFRPCSFAEKNEPIAVWHPSGIATYPYTGQNRDTVLRIHNSGRWAARPKEIVMEGSNTGQYSMLLFKPPGDGNYKLKVLFEGVHIGLSSTDVHVLLNDTALFNDFIEGYGGDTSFSAITGSHPTAAYSTTLSLKKTDTLIFAVGYGANKTYFNDTTGLLITLEMD